MQRITHNIKNMLKEFKLEFENKGEIYLKIKAWPGAEKTEIKELLADNTIKINIAAPPVKGKANQELIKFFAKEFRVEKRNIKIISGKQEKIKLLKIKKYEKR